MVPLLNFPSRIIFVLILLSSLLPSTLWGVYPQLWTDSSFADFAQGKLEGVSLTTDGRLIPAPGLEEIFDPKQAFLLSSALDSAGNLIVGSGSDGKVYRISNSRGTEIATLEEPGVYAIAADTQGIYVATSPDGKVYRLTQDGGQEIFFDPDDKYIWSMVIDRQGIVYVGTGPRGVIYKVTPDGSASILYDSTQTHIVSLAWDVDSNLLAGSAPGALLYRFDSSGQPYVLLDSDREEIRAIAIDRIGQIFVAAIAGGPPREQAATEKVNSDQGSTEESRVQVADSKDTGRMTIYRINRQDLVEPVYSSDTEVAFDLLTRSDGKVLVATGSRGRVLVLDPGQFVTVLSDTGEEQATALKEQGDGVLITTSNLGKVLRLSPESSEAGNYVSRVFDAEVTSRWGQIRWSASPQLDGVRVFTRTGNTGVPDDTWSDWSGPYDHARGSVVQSRPARFLQYKIEFPAQSRTGSLTSRGGFVDMVSISYLQHNLAPVVEQVTVHAPGVAFINFPQANQAGGIQPGGPEGAHLRVLPPAMRTLEGPQIQPPPRKVYIPGARSISWEARDRNGDQLVYSLHLRRQGESEWILLEEGLQESQYTMDGASFPEAEYTVRVTASDQPSNPPAEARLASLISRTFVISNSGPSIEWNPPQIDDSDAVLSFKASSKGTSIFQAEYSLDNQNWIIILPEDGIADSEAETYQFQISRGPTSKLVRLRVSDTAGNLATSSQTIESN